MGGGREEKGVINVTSFGRVELYLFSGASFSNLVPAEVDACAKYMRVTP